MIFFYFNAGKVKDRMAEGKSTSTFKGQNYLKYFGLFRKTDDV